MAKGKRPVSCVLAAKGAPYKPRRITPLAAGAVGLGLALIAGGCLWRAWG